MFSPVIYDLAAKVIAAYQRKGRRLVTAESCTGGLVTAALTEISGSSQVVERGFITYSNDAKTEVLAVMPHTLEEFGAVSEPVAEAMAKGALEFSQADVALSVTGIAGPTGGTMMKPVGLVIFGLATREGALFHSQSTFNGDRTNVRHEAVKEALSLLLSIVED